ncbi:MAG TPA: response regulator transcription factor [Sulfuriferula sp.]|nr:response regulator transcription factor [Sulfuriferula sp.]
MLNDCRTLVVEDTAEIADLIRLHLEDLGLQVTCAADGIAGLELARSGMFDLIVLDLMLPGLNGLEVCRALRADTRQYTPILMLTAKASEIDRVVGLELGADDYLGKPFSIPELQARAKALLRRSEKMRGTVASNDASTVRAGDLEIDSLRHEVRLSGRPVMLTAKEFDLLLFLAQNPGRVYSRAQLLDAVWSTTLESYEHNVNTHINRLRAKVEADPANPQYVLTVRGVGYRFADT